MSEKRIELKPIQVDFKCPKCMIGYLRPTNVSYMSNPPQYPHQCTDCIYSETFNIKYPYIEYEKLNKL